MSLTTTATQGAGEQRVNFLNLMIAQLRNQDPMAPLDNYQMTSQLAQLSQLDQMEQMNTAFRDVLLYTEAKYAASLIGKQVSWVAPGTTSPVTGRVTGAEQANGEIRLRVLNDTVALKDVVTVSE